MTTRVLVIESSYFIREMVCCLLESDPDIEVIATAEDMTSSLRLARQLQPDVVTLDAELAGIHGRGFLEKLLGPDHAPLLMMTSLTRRCMDTSLRALEMGAFDVVVKSAASAKEMTALREQLVTRVLAAHAALSYERVYVSAIDTAPLLFEGESHHKLIAIGAAHGGVEALGYLLSRLPTGLPPIVVTQQLPEPFLKPMAERLNTFSPLSVRPAIPGMPLLSSHAYIATGPDPIGITRRGKTLMCTSLREPEDMSHSAILDRMFSNVADELGEEAIGVILTGMGADGVEGLLAMRKAGALTLAQTCESSMAADMPQLAGARGAAERHVPLARLPDVIMELC